MSVEDLHPQIQRALNHKDNVTTPCDDKDSCESLYNDNTLNGMNKPPNWKIDNTKPKGNQNDIITSRTYSNGDVYSKEHVGISQINHLFALQETQLKTNSPESISTVDSNSNLQTIPGPKRKNRQSTANKAQIPAKYTTLIQSNGSIGTSSTTTTGNGRQNCTSSGGYPGVSWNRRMGAWLSFYYDNYCRRSRTFHPKHYNMDVEAARLAAVSFIKTVEGNPRSKKIKRTDKGIRPKLTAIVPKTQYTNVEVAPTTANTPHCQPINNGEYVSSAGANETRGWNPYYVVPTEDYYGGESYWNSIPMPEPYTLPEPLCGYANNSMVGFVLPPLGYMNYDGYYSRHLAHTCPQTHNLAVATSPNKDYTQSHYVTPIGPISNIYDTDKRSDLESPFYLNSLKCSQPATTSTGFYMDQ